MASWLGCCLLAQPLSGQITSTLSGQVLDPQGLGLPEVTIRARRTATGLDLYAESDETGSYSLSGLFAGVYEVTASRQGFADTVLSGIEITVNSNPSLNIPMNLVSVHSAATVSASASQLETETSALGSVINPRRSRTSR